MGQKGPVNESMFRQRSRRRYCDHFGGVGVADSSKKAGADAIPKLQIAKQTICTTNDIFFQMLAIPAMFLHTYVGTNTKGTYFKYHCKKELLTQE